MSRLQARRQRTPKYPVSVGRMVDAEIEVIDRAAALKKETRAEYMRRVLLREANADLRDAERKAQAVA